MIRHWRLGYERLLAALDRRGEEERAKALERAAREADAVHDEQTQVWEENGGEEGTPAFYLDGRKPTDEEWIRQGGRMGGAGGADAAEEIARRIRFLAAAPSGDAPSALEKLLSEGKTLHDWLERKRDHLTSIGDVRGACVCAEALEDDFMRHIELRAAPSGDAKGTK